MVGRRPTERARRSSQDLTNVVLVCKNLSSGKTRAAESARGTNNHCQSGFPNANFSYQSPNGQYNSV